MYKDIPVYKGFEDRKFSCLYKLLVSNSKDNYGDISEIMGYLERGTLAKNISNNANISINQFAKLANHCGFSVVIVNQKDPSDIYEVKPLEEVCNGKCSVQNHAANGSGFIS